MSQQSTPSSQQPGHDELAAMRRELATVHARLDRVTRRPTRRRLFARLAPLGIVALLVALLPLSLLAANPFTDLVPGSVHNGNIDAIYNAGITTGCVPNAEYCPTAFVTRQEMASFLARTAGLGGNPPVANAANAINAGNAQTVDNKSANEIVRVAFAEDLDFTVVAAFTNIVSTTITVPGPGFVLVTAAIRTDTSGGACPCEYRHELIDPATGATSLTYRTRHEVTGSVDAAAATHVFPVAAAGPRTFAVQSNVGTGTATSVSGRVTITALYVPFGSTGAATLEVTPATPAQPGGTGDDADTR
jgi:hypothetical protein